MGKCEKWTVAYRKRNGTATLIDDPAAPFTPIPNTWRYWRADPFLFEQDGKTFLFAELYDRMHLRGVIGYCELTEEGAGEWSIVIEEPFHLSYPFLFCRGDQVYMIPESFRGGKILLYKAVRFPDRWEKVRELADMVAVDSTVIHTDGGDYMLTFRIIERQAELVCMAVSETLELSQPRVLSEKEDPNARPAGNAFYRDGELIRPTQDCTRGYGYALNFARISRLDENGYEEQLFKKILPEDVKIQGVSTPEGIHTYNMTHKYEVIDYKEYEFGLVCKAARVIWRLTGRTN